jgi:hypothetical protein
MPLQYRRAKIWKYFEEKSKKIIVSQKKRELEGEVRALKAKHIRLEKAINLSRAENEKMEEELLPAQDEDLVNDWLPDEAEQPGSHVAKPGV